MNNASVKSMPFLLRGNEVKRHMINIDSRFRQNPTQTTPSDYYFQLSMPIKNVLRVRITSMEFPNNFAFFTALHNNVSIRIVYTLSGQSREVEATVKDGNYTAQDMITELNSVFTKLGLSWLVCSFDFISGYFYFTGNSYFEIDTKYNSIERQFDYGLGYYLGLNRGILQSAYNPTTNKYTLNGDFTGSFNGDNYVFLKINDYEFVQHTMNDNTIGALAKIILRDPKTYMTFDDLASGNAKEVVFKAPQNISRLHIQFVNAYGEDINLKGTNHSFTMEVLEIQDSSLYNAVRETLYPGYN